MNPHTQRILSRALPSSLDESKGTTTPSSSSSPAAFSFSASLNGGVGLPKEGSDSGEREFKRQRERGIRNGLFAALNSGLFFFVLFSQRDCPRFEKHIQTLNNPLKKKERKKGGRTLGHYCFPSFLSNLHPFTQ